MNEPKPTLNVLAIVKPNGERFVFIYDDETSSEGELLNTFGKYAADPNLDFNWRDAAMLSQKMVRMRERVVREAGNNSAVESNRGIE